MMEVEVAMWVWTDKGMVLAKYVVGDRYIRVQDAERLLEEAHRRGWFAAKESQRDLPKQL